MLPSEFPEVAPYEHVGPLLRIQVDMQFVDLRTLLQLPERAHGLDGGCNLTAATLLCNITAGASVLFYEASIEGFADRNRRGPRFVGLMERYFPWQPDDMAQGREGADVFWKFTRNPLSHTLGVGKDAATFPGTPGKHRPVVVSKFQDGLPDNDAVERLLNSEEFPVWIGRPTITRHAVDGYNISVEALSWGTNRMLRDLFADEEQATAAEETARQLLKGP